MLNPDQTYVLRQLQLHDLRAEAAQARISREVIGNQTAWGRCVTWLRSVGLRDRQRRLHKALSDHLPK